MEEREVKVEIDEKIPDSKDKIKNSGFEDNDKDKAKEPGEIAVDIKRERNSFDYLISLEDESIPFSVQINEKGNIIEEKSIYEDENKIFKYTICISLKDNSTNNCFLLEKTIKGVMNNFGELSSLQIKPEDIYIFVFTKKLTKNNGYLVTKESLSKINKEHPFLKM